MPYDPGDIWDNCKKKTKKKTKAKKMKKKKKMKMKKKRTHVTHISVLYSNSSYPE